MVNFAKAGGIVVNYGNDLPDLISANAHYTSLNQHVEAASDYSTTDVNNDVVRGSGGPQWGTGT